GPARPGPARPGAPVAALADLDLWPDQPLAHLAAVGEGGLAGIVLSGWVDRLARRDQQRLVGLSAAKVAPGGSLVVVSTSPAVWDRRPPPVEADLAGGRPLHPATWSRLLAEAGFDVLRVHAGPSEPGLDPLPGDDPATASINAELARLDQALFGPVGYAVTATRSS
ncbi:MAG: hypothetical protein ACRD0J_17070, partial [Acidimicrobiales bacterium]